MDKFHCHDGYILLHFVGKPETGHVRCACRSTADARFEPQCHPAVATAISDDSKQQGQERKVEEDDYIIHYDFDCGYLCAPDF